MLRIPYSVGCVPLHATTALPHALYCLTYCTASGIHHTASLTVLPRKAEAIREKLIDNVSKAGIPGREHSEWERLLHIVIVGGGPTGVEVAGGWRYSCADKALRWQ